MNIQTIKLTNTDSADQNVAHDTETNYMMNIQTIKLTNTDDSTDQNVAHDTDTNYMMNIQSLTHTDSTDQNAAHDTETNYMMNIQTNKFTNTDSTDQNVAHDTETNYMTNIQSLTHTDSTDQNVAHDQTEDEGIKTGHVIGHQHQTAAIRLQTSICGYHQTTHRKHEAQKDAATIAHTETKHCNNDMDIFCPTLFSSNRQLELLWSVSPSVRFFFFLTHVTAIIYTHKI